MVVIAGCVIVKNNKILMVKEAKKKCYGQWSFPGGHVEENELITDAAIREVYEETGYLLDPHGACGYRALAEELKEGEVGLFLETAHPAKFLQTVESIIGVEVKIPEKLQAFMKGTKQSVPMSKDFAAFKAYLMKQ